jgi:hypothetical protein
LVLDSGSHMFSKACRVVCHCTSFTWTVVADRTHETPQARLSCFSGGFPHFHEQGKSSLKGRGNLRGKFRPQAVLRNEQTSVWARKKFLINFPPPDCSSCIANVIISSQILRGFATTLISLLVNFPTHSDNRDANSYKF